MACTAQSVRAQWSARRRRRRHGGPRRQRAGGPEDGRAEVEILHAYRNPIRAWDPGDGFTMLIGASQALIILEIG